MCCQQKGSADSALEDMLLFLVVRHVVPAYLAGHGEPALPTLKLEKLCNVSTIRSSELDFIVEYSVCQLHIEPWEHRNAMALVSISN